jgi:hypothetical protein
MSAGHHFAPPWSVEEQDGCFAVRDRHGRALRYVYFKDGDGQRSAAALFTREEARHLAAAVAKLPDLWRNNQISRANAVRQTVRSDTN